MRTLIAAILMFACAAFAPTKQDLKSRAEQRYPQIKQAKSAGKIGETSDGFLEAVKSDSLDDAKLKQFVDEENADRLVLYKLIAEDQHIDASLVARRAAARNFEHADKAEYLKDNGTWRQK